MSKQIEKLKQKESRYIYTILKSKKKKEKKIKSWQAKEEIKEKEKGINVVVF